MDEGDRPHYMKNRPARTASRCCPTQSTTSAAAHPKTFWTTSPRFRRSWSAPVFCQKTMTSQVIASLSACSPATCLSPTRTAARSSATTASARRLGSEKDFTSSQNGISNTTAEKQSQRDRPFDSVSLYTIDICFPLVVIPHPIG